MLCILESEVVTTNINDRHTVESHLWLDLIHYFSISDVKYKKITHSGGTKKKREGPVTLVNCPLSSSRWVVGSLSGV